MNIQLDDGFQFGLGLFETICLKNKKPVLLDWHLERINHSMQCFGVQQEISWDEVLQWLAEHEQELDEVNSETLHALKIMVSEKNKLFLFRNNPYTKEILAKGFRLDYSPVLRNETSIFTYHKTMNYGDNILEKRRTKSAGIDEVVFLNSKGQICEGSTTNIFFANNGKIYTPSMSCGMLLGIMRRYILENTNCTETILYPEDVAEMEECFVTNSLMGIMHVTQLGEKIFRETNESGKIYLKYQGTELL